MKFGSFVVVAIVISLTDGFKVKVEDKNIFNFTMTSFFAEYSDKLKKSKPSNKSKTYPPTLSPVSETLPPVHSPVSETLPPVPSPTSPTCSDVSVVITTDDNPEENYYIITDMNEKQIMTGDSLTEQRKTYTRTNCLPYGNYLFTIYDTAGNGMCCEYGPGGFNLYANEVLVDTGGGFTYNVTIPFTTFDVPTPAPHSDDGDPVKPTPPTDDGNPVKPTPAPVKPTPVTEKPTPKPVASDDD